MSQTECEMPVTWKPLQPDWTAPRGAGGWAITLGRLQSLARNPRLELKRTMCNLLPPGIIMT